MGWFLYVEGILWFGLVELGVDLLVWLLVGVVMVDVVDGYEWLVICGYWYGLVFCGLIVMWVCGEEIFVEVRLLEVVGGVGGFGVYLVLLDVVLYVVVIVGDLDEFVLLFVW